MSAFSRWKTPMVSLGGVPVAVPVVLAAVVVAAGIAGRVPEDMIGGLAVTTGLGLLLGPLGDRLPGISRIGGGTLLCLLVPSVLVHAGVLGGPFVDAVSALMTRANFLYLVISALAVGSILGLDRSRMLHALVKILPPLAVGTAAAVAAGLGVATAFGYPLRESFFFIVVPIMGGGVTQGVIPLSSTYAGALGADPADLTARLVAAAVIGNVVAVVFAGLLGRLGERRPALDGSGELVRLGPAGGGAVGAGHVEPASAATAGDVGVGVLTISSLYVAGYLAEPALHLPAPVLVIVVSVIGKMIGVFPASVEQSTRAVSDIVSRHLIHPTVIGVGVLYVPLAGILDVVSIGFVLTCVAVVAAMAATGFLLARWLGMYPVEAALVSVCHGALGGTGDLAVLAAADRPVLMPFAQISTRVGGAVTVIGAASLFQALL